ncbi:hypothetical protein SAMN02910400_01028 [Lachnospiraceae bacterium C10]|nr:hypothetical protein SAMN02910400_01028 [Lachnospiraceae bacterium C10]
MKNNSIFMMFLVVLAITVVFALIVRVCVIDKHVKDEVTDGKGSVQPAILKEKVEVISDDAWKEYENADKFVVELVERTTIETERGFETEYDRYIVSDVDLKNQTDDTKDYHDALLESDGEIDEGVKLSFKDAFGISYAGKNGRELYESLLKQYGFGEDFNDVTFDEDTNKLTGQNLYVFNEKNDVTDYLLEGEVVDEIVESKVCYQLGDETGGVRLPEYFSASVRYKAGDQVITKSLYLSVLIMDSKEGEEVVDA